MKSYEARVESFFRGSSTRFFEEDASRISHPGQQKRFKDSFAISNGATGTIDFESIGETRIDYEGQLTLVSSLSSSNFLPDFCSGPDVSIINYPSAVNEFRSRLQDRGTRNNAAFCLSVSGYNFHCFLFEILPALFVFKGDLSEADALLLGATEGGSFIGEFNQLLGIHKSIELLPLRSSIQIKNTIGVTSFPFRIYPVDIIEDIRLRVIHGSKEIADIRGSEICFIGRADKDRNRRNLLNEAAVLKEIVDSFGKVLVVRPGITQLAETVVQISEARVIVGMLGGSLAHLIWAKSLELFIEIVPYTYFGVSESEELSKIYGFQYRRITSSNVGSESWAWADQTCDLEELRRVLRDCGTVTFN